MDYFIPKFKNDIKLKFFEKVKFVKSDAKETM